MSEKNPATTPMQEHWAHNLPILERLRNAFEPFANHVHQEAHAKFGQTTAADRQTIIDEAGNTYILPYGEGADILPPGLFGQITLDNVRLTHDLTVPTNVFARRVMAERYLHNRKKMSSKAHQHAIFPARGTLLAMLEERKGQRYSEANWWMGAYASKLALNHEKYNALEGHYAHRFGNANSAEKRLSTDPNFHRYDEYALTMTRKAPEDKSIHPFRDVIQIPVGEYGQDAASKLARATLAINDFIRDSWIVDSGVRTRLDKSTENLLTLHTARTREYKNKRIKEHAIHGQKLTLAEGVISVAQTLSFLTAEKVPGYDTHDELVSTILDSNLIEQFTHTIQPGFIAPTTLAGFHTSRPLTSKGGKLTLDKGLVKRLSAQRKDYQAEMIKEWQDYRNSTDKKKIAPTVLGLVCPAANSNGSLRQTTGLLQMFYPR